jgi:hypothetical protein
VAYYFKQCSRYRLARPHLSYRKSSSCPELLQKVQDNVSSSMREGPSAMDGYSGSLKEESQIVKDHDLG